MIHQQNLVNLENKHTITTCNKHVEQLANKAGELENVLKKIEVSQPNLHRLLSESNLLEGVSSPSSLSSSSTDGKSYISIGITPKLSIKEVAVAKTDTNANLLYKPTEFDSTKQEQLLKTAKENSGKGNKDNNFWSGILRQ